MSAETDIELEIDQNGIHYKERGTLGWLTKELDWADVSQIEVTDIESVDETHDDGLFELTGRVAVERPGRELQEDEESDILNKVHADTGIAVDIDAERVSFDPRESDAENFRAFFRYLVEEGYITKDDLPFKTDKQENYILNTEPEHPKGDMRRGQEVGNGVWLETSIPINQKQHHILVAAKEFLQ